MPTIVKNPQAGLIVECMHLSIGYMLQMTVFKGNNWWFKMNYTLQVIVWVLRTTVPSIIQYIPGTLVFDYDMIMQTKVKVDWGQIKKKRDQRSTDPKFSKPTEGPYTVNRVHRNRM
eukprot:9877131-Ditylum_brightwellii.AAC.1